MGVHPSTPFHVSSGSSVLFNAVDDDGVFDGDRGGGVGSGMSVVLLLVVGTMVIVVIFFPSINSDGNLDGDVVVMVVINVGL